MSPLQPALPTYPTRAQHDHGPVSTYLVLVTIVGHSPSPNPTRIKVLLDWTPDQAAEFDAQLKSKPGSYVLRMPGVRADYSYRYEYRDQYGDHYYDVEVTAVQPAGDSGLVMYERDYEVVEARDRSNHRARMAVRWDLPRLRSFNVRDWRSVTKLAEQQEEGEEITLDYHVPGAHGDSWWETGHVEESSPVVVRVRRASDGCPLRVYEVLRRKAGTGTAGKVEVTK